MYMAIPVDRAAQPCPSHNRQVPVSNTEVQYPEYPRKGNKNQTMKQNINLGVDRTCVFNIEVKFMDNELLQVYMLPITLSQEKVLKLEPRKDTLI